MTNDYEIVTIKTKQGEDIANTQTESEKSSTNKNLNIIINGFQKKGETIEKPFRIPIQINRKFKLILICLIFSIYFIQRFAMQNFFSLENFEKSLNTSNKCFYDVWLLLYTRGLNKFFAENLFYRDLMVVFSTSLMDILSISFLIYFVKYSNCGRALLTLFIFYFIRANIQKIFLLSFYENYLFEYFGAFSFTVPLGRTADYFYSGHCGCSMILTLFYRDKGINIYYYFGLFVILVQIFTLTITRAHYSIDILYGIIIGHYLYIIVGIFLEEVFPKITPFIKKFHEFFKNLMC